MSQGTEEAVATVSASTVVKRCKLTVPGVMTRHNGDIKEQLAVSNCLFATECSTAKGVPGSTRTSCGSSGSSAFC